jgi:hypothetical protein
MCLTDYSSAVLNDSLVLGGWSPFNVSARHGRVPVTSHLAGAQSRITDSRRVDHGNKLLLFDGWEHRRSGTPTRCSLNCIPAALMKRDLF